MRRNLRPGKIEREIDRYYNMIISASRRTDIPAFYAPWFFNRLRDGYLLVPNPFNPKAVSRVSLDPVSYTHLTLPTT